MGTKSSQVAILCSILACLTQSATGEVVAATFDEYVGIGSFSTIGSDLGTAESVDLSVLPANFENRGGGTGTATAGNVLPVAAQTDLHLFGGSNISGIGGTTYVLTTFQFVVEANGLGGDDFLPLIFSAFGSVSVDSNQQVGQTFARITTDFVGQLEVNNYDAFGEYTGNWSQQWDLDFNAARDQVYTITTYARSHGQGSGDSYYFDSSVFIDPIVYFDPDFAASDQYRIVYSPGIIAPMPVVPEPSSLALVTVGLCMTLRSRIGQRKRPNA